MSLSTADVSILLPAFAAGLLVTATHVPLGMQVLARGIVFIDLAIAQIAGCGVLLADQLGFEPEGAALAAAVGGAGLCGDTGVVGRLAAASGAHRLLCAVRGCRHGLGTTCRLVPRFRDADRSAAGDADDDATAARNRMGARRC